MYLSVSIYVNCVKEVFDLLLVVEVRREKLLDIFASDIPVILFVDLKEDFSKSLSFLLVDLATVGNNVLNALTKK
jgi:hypothetical protein